MFLIHLFINVSQPLQKYINKKYRIVITWSQHKPCPSDELGKSTFYEHNWVAWWIFICDTEMRQSGIEPRAVFQYAHVQH